MILNPKCTWHPPGGPNFYLTLSFMIGDFEEMYVDFDRYCTELTLSCISETNPNIVSARGLRTDWATIAEVWSPVLCWRGVYRGMGLGSDHVCISTTQRLAHTFFFTITISWLSNYISLLFWFLCVWQPSCCRALCFTLSSLLSFLSDPGVSGVRSMGPVVWNWDTFCRLNWCDFGWWRYKLNTCW